MSMYPKERAAIFIDGANLHSTIKSKKLTALTVKAIIDKPNKTIKNVLKISIKKF